MSLKNLARPAKVHYLSGHFQLLSHGDHVVCAVSGEQIQLEQLRYWSVEKQEAYASGELASKAALGL